MDGPVATGPSTTTRKGASRYFLHIWLAVSASGETRGWGGVQVRYEPIRDILTLHLRPGVAIVEVAEDVSGTVFGYDGSGDLVLIEIHDATRNVDKIRDIERVIHRVAVRLIGE